MNLDVTKVNLSTAGSEASQAALANEMEESKKFAEVLEYFDSQQETPAERRERLDQEEKVAQASRARNKKINALLALIAQLKSKLISGGYDEKVAAELSAAQNQLFWLKFGM